MAKAGALLFAIIILLGGSVMYTKLCRLEAKTNESSAIIEMESATTESTTTTEETTTTTATVVTQPEKPLILLDMQRRLDVVNKLLEDEKEEAEYIRKEQELGKALNNQQVYILNEYSMLIIEKRFLTDSIDKLETKWRAEHS